MVIAPLRTVSQRPSFPAFRPAAFTQEWAPTDTFEPVAQPPKMAAKSATPGSAQKFAAVLAEAQQSAEVSPWNDVQDWNIAKAF